MSITSMIQSAFKYHQKGNLTQAELLYKEILQKQPANFDALHMLGVLYFQKCNHDSAKSYLEKALRINNTNAFVYFHLGNLFQQTEQFNEAIQYYQKALQINPQFADAHFNLGLAFQEKGQLDEAIVSYQKAVRLNPEHAHAYYNLGNSFMIQNKLDEAIENYNCAIKINPRYADALLNKGFALYMQGKFEEALKCYQLSLKINPNSTESYSNLGNLLKDLGQMHDAELCFRHALQLKPEHSMYYSNLLLAMIYNPFYDSQTVYAEHLRFANKIADSLSHAILSHSNERATDRRLKIGYVSPDFRKHSVACFIEAILPFHNRQHFEVFCYSDVLNHDEVTERFKGYTDHWRNIEVISDEKVSELIRNDSIDILVDLAGHTSGNRLLVFARKPAPVQITWIGYPATTGLSAMDYKIVDSYTDPSGITEEFYTE
ncbi:MAG: tetratricopeptide repeat protein, partial [Nitrospira sp.]|nr:tetratricopeptide repeat protein [Nitrospira sp.]